MQYEKQLTIPKNTPSNNQTILSWTLTKGVIRRVEVEFPSGCFGLVHVSIWHMNHQLWPSNPDEEFASDDHVIVFETYYEMTEEPSLLSLHGWNEDDTYDHTITFRVTVFKKYYAYPYLHMQKLLQLLGKVFGVKPSW